MSDSHPIPDLDFSWVIPPVEFEYRGHAIRAEYHIEIDGGSCYRSLDLYCDGRSIGHPDDEDEYDLLDEAEDDCYFDSHEVKDLIATMLDRHIGEAA